MEPPGRSRVMLLFASLLLHTCMRACTGPCPGDQMCGTPRFRVPVGRNGELSVRFPMPKRGMPGLGDPATAAAHAVAVHYSVSLPRAGLSCPPSPTPFGRGRCTNPPGTNNNIHRLSNATTSSGPYNYTALPLTQPTEPRSACSGYTLPTCRPTYQGDIPYTHPLPLVQAILLLLACLPLRRWHATQCSRRKAGPWTYPGQRRRVNAVQQSDLVVLVMCFLCTNPAPTRKAAHTMAIRMLMKHSHNNTYRGRRRHARSALHKAIVFLTQAVRLKAHHAW